MTWFSNEEDWQSAIQQQAGLAAKFTSLVNSFNSLEHIPADVLLLCQQRVQQLHGCTLPPPRSLHASLVEKLALLASWHEAQVFTEAERACLAFSELYAIDHAAINDEQANAVKAFYGDAGLVALVQALGLYYGMSRMHLLWDIDAKRDS